MNRCGAILIAGAVLLSACSEAATPSSNEAVATTTAPSEVEQTSNEPTTATPTSSSETSGPALLTGPCKHDALSNDLRGEPGAVAVVKCDRGWASGYFLQGDGDIEFVAQWQDGAWVQVAGMGVGYCREDLVAAGAPASMAQSIVSCADVEVEELDAGFSDCDISSQEFGASITEIDGLTCGEAQEIWNSAEEVATPVAGETIVTPQGWQCDFLPGGSFTLAKIICVNQGEDAMFIMYV